MPRPWKIVEDDENDSNVDIDKIIEERQAAKKEAEATEAESADKDLRKRMSLFIAELPKRTLNHLVVSETTRREIESLLAKVVNHEYLYEVWNLKSIDPHGGRTGINLYGPPGTGKSLCAEAIAAALKQNLIRVNYAEIESKYVGDTPKNIRAAFAKAREENAVLFFDEADSILGRRLTNVTQSADHGVNVSRSVMLMELDRFDGVTIFATNLPSNYDEAFVRRIIGHVEMPLPDHKSRVRLWQIHIPEEMPVSLDSEDWNELADNSDGLSGGEILNAVVSAASTAVQRKGNRRRVELQDLLTAIDTVKKAKDQVGNKEGKTYLQSEKVPIEDAPDDVQDRFRQMRNDSEALDAD